LFYGSFGGASRLNKMQNKEMRKREMIKYKNLYNKYIKSGARRERRERENESI
jgi:hypothetical protein